MSEHPDQSTPRWEYVVELLRLSEQRESFIDHPGPSAQAASRVENSLNRKGERGWELVAVVPVGDARGSVSHAYYHFRRPKTD